MDGRDLEQRVCGVAERVKRSDRGFHKWPDELRAEIVEYARRCNERGESDNRIAGRLGLHQSTLSRWLRAARASAFRQVAIVPRKPETAPAEPPPLRLITPQGSQVERLDMESLAVLLRALG